jgi:hypothetical protein
MKHSLRLFCISCLLISSGQSMAGALGRQTTGTSTETSRSSSSTSSVGSCAGDSTAERSTSTSDTSVTSGCAVTPPDVDNDGDGMISSWEMANELDQYNVADKLLDLDNDHISNLVEYLRELAANDADFDGDGVLDGDDIDPADPEAGMPSVDGSYGGAAVTEYSQPQ